MRHSRETRANSDTRWVGTGRTVLNNKGNPVKQYEPYFSVTDAFESEPELVETGVTPILHYDPLGRLVRTDLPDGSFSKVEFTPWMQTSFDPNDTVWLKDEHNNNFFSDWYIHRNSPDPANPEPLDPETRAAWLAAKHANTPTVSHFDSLGRAFYVIADNKSHGEYVTRTILDIEGNESQIIDARGNTVMEYHYGIHGEKGFTRSMDAGDRYLLITVDAKPLYTWDSRGHRLHAHYDGLRRPTKQWLSVNGATDTLVGFTVYGESASSPQVKNLRGKPWKSFDQSGLTQSVSFDFKGNLLEGKRQLAIAYKTSIDWNVADPDLLLESEAFTTQTAFDALNRAISIKTPHHAQLPASEVIPTYNEASLLNAVDVKLRGAAIATNFVQNIDYDAKGQRERIQYGNTSTTRYTYDEKTFRLRQLLTTRDNGAERLQDLNYTYDPVGNIAQITDNAQQTIFYNGQVVSPTQKFEYDALYRLMKATGREHRQSGCALVPEAGYTENYSPVNHADSTALQNYASSYDYDEVGNILALIHKVNGSVQWRRDYSYESASNRLVEEIAAGITTSYTHNIHGSMTKMNHLSAMDWDFAERLGHVIRGSGSAVTEAYYNYDGSGQRVRKVVEKGSITETRLYLGGFEIYRKSTGGLLGMERETLHVMDDKHRIALVETLTVDASVLVANPVPVFRYQLDNHLGSASLELDESASIISYEEYYPYGSTSYQMGRSGSEVKSKLYRYTGKEKDEESGLYYHGARYYACWLGRWTASDPAGLVDGVNLYMYVRGNPVRLHDPSGHGSEEHHTSTLGTDKSGKAVINDTRGTSSGSFSTSPTTIGGMKGSSGGRFAPADATRVTPKQAESHIGDATRTYSGVGSYDITRPSWTVNYSKDPVGSFVKDVVGMASNAVATPLNIGTNLLGMTVGQVPEEVWGGIATLDATMPGWGGVVEGAIKEVGVGGIAASRLMKGLAKVNLGEAKIPVKLVDEVAGSEALGGVKEIQYAPRVRARGVEDPKSHNFPYSFDKDILATEPIPKNNGYQIYRLDGSMTGSAKTLENGSKIQTYKEGYYEIGVTKDGIVDHRYFKPKD